MTLRSLVFSATLAAVFIAPQCAFAQVVPAATPAPASVQPDSSRQHHRGMMRLFSTLNLSDTQKAQIKQLTDQFHAAHPKGSPRDPAAHKALLASIMNILTPDQRAKLQQQIDQMHADGRTAGPDTGRMFAQLNLSDAQKAQIEQLVQQYRAQHPQGSAPDPKSRKALRDSIFAVLTPEQRVQLEQMHGKKQ